MYKINRFAIHYFRKLKEVIRKMTVISDVKQALANLRSAQASFEGFALATDDQNAKKMYQDAAVQTSHIISMVEPRKQEIENQEPQYKS